MLIVSFYDYVQTPSCGFEVEYDSKLKNDGNLPSFIQFDKKYKRYLIYTTSKSNVGEYKINVKATLQNPSSQIFDQSMIWTLTVRE